MSAKTTGCSSVASVHKHSLSDTMAQSSFICVSWKTFFLLITLSLQSCLVIEALALRVQRMTSQEYRSQRQRPGGPLALDRPILISDALSQEECEVLCEQWLDSVGSEMITVQRKQTPINGQEVVYDQIQCTVAQSVNLLMNSKVNDSIFAFLEGFLDSNQVFGGYKFTNLDMKQQQKERSLDSIQRRLLEAREALFSMDTDTNWFDFFPSNAKPSDCVIMAGEGATSTLHRDPFEWTGTSLCLEGRKIWRFLNGDCCQDWDARLQCYRLNSTAWDEVETSSSEKKRMTLSAGWQSNLSLYQIAKRQRLLSARQLSEMDESLVEEYLEEMAGTFKKLKPHKDIQPVPVMCVDCCSVVQHPGELLIIPPYWYHQTYAPEPSVAVASQRCGTCLDATRVVQHILSLQSTKVSPSGLPQSLQKFLRGTIDPMDMNIEETVEVLFKHLNQL